MKTNITLKMKKVVGITAYSDSDLTTEILVDLYYAEKPIIAYAKDKTINGVVNPNGNYITENLNTYQQSDCEYMLKYWMLPAYMVREDGNTDAFYIKDNEIYASFGYSSNWSYGFDNNIIEKVKDLNVLPSSEILNPYGIEIVNGSEQYAYFTYDSVNYRSPYSKSGPMFVCESIDIYTEAKCSFNNIGLYDITDKSDGLNINVPGKVGMYIVNGSDANKNRLKCTPNNQILFTVYGIEKIEV